MEISAILAPVDFSMDSAHGVRLARALAERNRARLTLLHVDSLPAYSTQVAEAAGPDVWIEYLKARDTELERRLRDFAEPLVAGCSADFELTRGEASKAIVEYALKRGSNLIVIAPHGSGHGARFLLGNVSAQVATDAGCPVLVARTRSATGIPEDGAFPNPLVGVSDEQRAARALELTSLLVDPTTSIQLMHILEGFEVSVGPRPPGSFQAMLETSLAHVRQRLETLAAPLRSKGLSAAVDVETGDPSFAILCRVEQNLNGLIVMARKTMPNGRGSLSTPAYRMVKHSPVPVLIVPGLPEHS